MVNDIIGAALMVNFSLSLQTHFNPNEHAQSWWSWLSPWVRSLNLLFESRMVKKRVFQDNLKTWNFTRSLNHRIWGRSENVPRCNQSLCGPVSLWLTSEDIKKRDIFTFWHTNRHKEPPRCGWANWKDVRLRPCRESAEVIRLDEQVNMEVVVHQGGVREQGDHIKNCH